MRALQRPLVVKRRFSAVLIALLFLVFLCWVAYASHQEAAPTIEFSYDSASGKWLVAEVVAISQVTETGARDGDILVRLDDLPVEGDANTAASHARRITVAHPDTGQEIIIERSTQDADGK